jgi:integrase
VKSTDRNRNHYELYIRPSLAGKHVKEWTPEDMRKLCSDLDVKVQANTIAWKTALNVWATATKMAGDAFASKLDTLRCRKDNPAQGVRGPDRGDDVGEQYLYPSEFLKFVECEDVPLEWRRVVALSIYLYPRDAELRALQCRDVDTDHLSMRVTKSSSRRTGTVQSTKGRRQRTVPLEANVVPLVDAMKAEQGDEGPLVAEMPSVLHMSRGLRTWLLKAGVDRHELHHATPTTRPIRFHDLRATGVTWMAVRGDDPLKIQHRAGHTDFQTTQRYIRTGEAVREGFGEPFPELPECLVGRSESHAVDETNRTRSSKYSESDKKKWRRRESNPLRNEGNLPGVSRRLPTWRVRLGGLVGVSEYR